MHYYSAGTALSLLAFGWSASAASTTQTSGMTTVTRSSSAAATTAVSHTGMWTSGLPTTTVIISTAKSGGRCNYAQFGTRAVCAPSQTCTKSASSYSTCKSTATTTVASSVASASASSATGSWLRPTAGSSFLWSLEAAIPSSPKSNTGLALSGLQVYDVDLFDATVQQIQGYKQQGKSVVCYFSAGSWEYYRDDAGSFDKTCYCNQGQSCKMEGWDEWWLDLRSPTCVANIEKIMTARIELAKTKGCDAVEPDNTDSYVNSPGWNTTIDDQFAYLTFLSNAAHANGLGIALKNGPDMIKNRPAIVDMTDFAIIEQCGEYNECPAYAPFVAKNKAAFQIEYERNITCSDILPGFFALAYSSFDVNYKYVTNLCPKLST